MLTKSFSSLLFCAQSSPGTLQHHERQELARSKTEQRIDDGDIRLVIEREQVVGVQVHIRA